MTQPNILELAKQGDANAIATLMNRKLQPKGITAKASMKNDCLQIMLEAAQVPPQETLVALLRKSIPSLGAECIKQVKVYGKQTGEEFPAWHEEFEVETQKLPNGEELAKQGDVNAIATLITQWLNSQSITVKVSLKNDCLQVKLESGAVPQPQIVVPLIRDRLINLDIQSIKKVKIFGQQIGDEFPDWQEEFELEKEEDLPTSEPEADRDRQSSISSIETQPDRQPSFWKSVSKMATGIGEAIGNTASQASQTVVNTVTGVSSAAANQTQKWIDRATIEVEPGTETDRTYPNDRELYHVFVADETANQGGSKQVTFRSGKSYDLMITPNTAEGSKLIIQNSGIQDNDAFVVLHTLFDPALNIDRQITNLINSAQIKPDSKTRCLEAYDLIKDDRTTSDLAALDLLDFIVSSSNLDREIRQRYTIASQNSRLIAIEKSIEEALTASQLSDDRKELLRGTYQYIRSGEAILDFSAITQLDSIVESSSLPTELKQKYFLASATSSAAEVDILIVKLLSNSPSIQDSDRLKYLAAYTKIRDGEEVADKVTLNSLDETIFNADIPETCKLVYKLARERFFEQKQEDGKEDLITSLKKFKADAELVKKKASTIIPTTTKIASSFGIKAGTGAAISGLSGSAATNATLAALGGGSVAAGGLGMLGGLAVATGGAALIGAAALVSIAGVSQMDAKDRMNLGIAAVAGTLTSAAAVGTAWAAVSAFGVASTGTAISTLSGAAAYSTIIAALGGVTAITGGAAAIAFGAGFAAWKLLKENSDKNRILQALEARLYSDRDVSLAASESSFWESIAKTATNLGESIGNTASQATQAVANLAMGGEKANQEILDLVQVPESDRVYFYGALFAIATADGCLDKEEMDLIFGIMDLEGMSESAKRQVQSYIIEPPLLEECLEALSTADEKLRFGLMVNLIDTALANDEMDANERKAIQLAQQKLGVTNQQVEAIEKFVREMRRIRDRGLDDNQAADAAKTAAAGLSAVGVPIAAVYFSGSVIGLSAAGITSGLAALGLGFGMVPGIGVAVILGAGIFWGVTQLLDTGGTRAKEEEMLKRERKAQLVIQNLQGTLDRLIERTDNLQKAATDAETNREAIRILTEKMRYLQQLLAKRKQAEI